ncbi:MAG: ABC transporter ATP-binding protein [Chitinophagia bacterium]|nr:ABC transporter ATP-binding protein [Chitinophagia bacterium]
MSFLRIFKYIHIPRKKLALYLFFTILATLFSLLSINALAPFMNIIFKTDSSIPGIKAKSLGRFNDFFQLLINDHGSLYALGVICLLMIVSILLKNLFVYLSLYISTPVRSQILADFRLRLYSKILQLPVGFFTEQKKGDLMSRMTGDINEVQGSIFTALEGLVKDPLIIISFLISMILLSPHLSLFLLLFLPITALFIGKISKRLKKQSTAHSVAQGENISHVEETLSSIKVIKAFRAEERMLNKFNDGNEKLFLLLNKMTLRRDLASPITEVLGVTVLCAILYIGGRFVFSEGAELTGGDLMAFILLFAMIINPAKNLSTTISSMQKGMGAVERIEEILNAPIQVEEKANAKVLSGFNQSIEFKNVSFKYDDKTVLKNINFVIQKGKTVALVGSSGAGKSTLADLIPRFHDVSEGAILIDGTDIKEFTLQSLRKQMSIVTQEAILFNDSIANNIALGDINASSEEITEAATIANAHQFIQHKENKYDTNIGDRGMKLSGGERQRITIARAVLQNPPILILDEATSSLDTESERLVQDAIVNLMQDRTSLVIAHRLSTISNADEIIVLQKGSIIERGTHDSLLSQNGFYKKLVEMQEIK